jgi:hypothetical protein
MKLPSKIRFFDKTTQEAYYRLEKGDNSEKELFLIMNQAMDNIEQNAFCGIQMPKRLIPREYVKKGIKNVWKYDLPRGWRLMYSIVNEELVVVSIILEWFSHKEYERRFKY